MAGMAGNGPAPGDTTGSRAPGAAGPEFPAEGVVKEQGLTTYMYGTHTLVGPDGQVLYALTSDDPDLLSRATGKQVRVYGTLVPGYPVDFGPPYLKVTRVAEG